MSNLSHAPLAALTGAERIIRFTTYEEIAARPNFRDNLTRDEAKPVKIIGVYVFREKRRCGLPDHTPHFGGLVVETASGYETIIGNVCGRREFGEEFQVLLNRANTQIKIQDNQDRLIAFRQRLPKFHEEIDRMRREERGSGWLNSSVEVFRRHCPGPLFEVIRALAKSGDGRVYESITLYGEDAVRRMLAEGRPLPERDDEQDQREVSYAVDEPRGTIAGLSVWGSTSIRELLIERVQARLIEFEGVDIYALSEAGLRKWVRFADEVDSLLRQAQALIDAGREFFTDENMKLFDHLRMPALVLSAFRRQRWDNATARWRCPP